MVDGRLVRLVILGLGGVVLLALAATGAAELALALAPAALVAALPLLGRFPGEAKILARRAGSVSPAVRVARRWLRPLDVDVPSLVGRCVRTVRGPPLAA